MTKKQKLLDSIRNNPRGVRFEDACRAAELIGFVLENGKGSHRVYAKAGESILNFQNRDGYIKRYQAMQLIAMMDKYGEDL